MTRDPVDRVIAAARQCYLARGIAATGMAEVAAAAGMARSSLYRHFPGRDEVLVAVIRREMEELNEVIGAALVEYSEPPDMLVEGLLLALREIPARPLLRAVFASDEDARARRAVWTSRAIVTFGEELMSGVIEPALAAGLLQTRVAPEVMVEWVYRVLLSFLTLPSNTVVGEAQMRDTLHALLVPVLLRGVPAHD